MTRVETAWRALRDAEGEFRRALATGESSAECKRRQVAMERAKLDLSWAQSLESFDSLHFTKLSED